MVVSSVLRVLVGVLVRFALIASLSRAPLIAKFPLALLIVLLVALKSFRDHDQQKKLKDPKGRTTPAIHGPTATHIDPPWLFGARTVLEVISHSGFIFGWAATILWHQTSPESPVRALALRLRVRADESVTSWLLACARSRQKEKPYARSCKATIATEQSRCFRSHLYARLNRAQLIFSVQKDKAT